MVENVSYVSANLSGLCLVIGNKLQLTGRKRHIGVIISQHINVMSFGVRIVIQVRSLNFKYRIRTTNLLFLLFVKNVHLKYIT